MNTSNNFEQTAALHNTPAIDPDADAYKATLREGVCIGVLLGTVIWLCVAGVVAEVML